MTSVDPYFGQQRAEIADLIPGNAEIIVDVGCGSGGLGQLLRDRAYSGVLIGIERNVEAAGEARKIYDSVYELDLDQFDRSHSSPIANADVIVLADVLEHLVDPWRFLETLVGGASGALVIVSLPNSQSLELLAPLMFGRFDYKESGIRDRTHLRFFDRRGAIRLLESAGLSVVSVRKIFPSRYSVASGIPYRLLGPFGVRQYVFSAVMRTT